MVAKNQLWLWEASAEMAGGILLGKALETGSMSDEA
jgi:hypothetical protein